MPFSPLAVIQRIFSVSYAPEPTCRTFMERAQTQTTDLAQVWTAVLNGAEDERIFGVPLSRRGIQPVYLKIKNSGPVPLRLYIVGLDPNYYTPLEAAAFNHFSVLKRLSAFGLVGWVFMPILFLMIPFKLVSAWRANRRMDQCFQSQALRLRPIPPGETSEGFVFTQPDAGTKAIRVLLHAADPLSREEAREMIDGTAKTTDPLGADRPAVDFTFYVAIPGIAADHLRKDFDVLCPAESCHDCDIMTLVEELREMPSATTNRRGTGTGDPVNLVVVGSFETVLEVFAPRWDESEVITLATCWKTAKSFVLGSQYRYSPVSPLFLFGRSQDVALQRTRHSINERLHLRLWMAPLRFKGSPVWVGQISRDIGVRFTPKTWNLTTHRVDPDVDESRDYVVEDLLRAQHVDAVGYVDGVGHCPTDAPRHNLTGDPYFTDGKRAVILLSATRQPPRFVMWA